MPMQTVSELIDAARRQGLVLTPLSDALDTMGLDFLVVHALDAAGRRWIVRSPRRPDVVAAARKEAAVLRLVAPRLPVAVPDWRVHTDDLIAYPRLDGVPAVTLDTGAPVWNHLDPKAPSAAFLDAMAGALAALLTVPAADARAAGLTVRTAAEERASLARAVEVSRPALRPPDALVARWERWLADDAMWPEAVALSHGDLHPGHLLLDERGALTGILDWTEAKVADPSIDLAMFLGCFGRAPTEALVGRLTALGAPMWPGIVDHAAERWAIGPAVGAEWALRTDNPGVLEYMRTMMAELLAPAS